MTDRQVTADSSNKLMKPRPPLDIKFGIRVHVNSVGSRVIIENEEDIMFLDVAGAYALRDWLNGALP